MTENKRRGKNPVKHTTQNSSSPVDTNEIVPFESDVDSNLAKNKGTGGAVVFREAVRPRSQTYNPGSAGSAAISSVHTVEVHEWERSFPESILGRVSNNGKQNIPCMEPHRSDVHLRPPTTDRGDSSGCSDCKDSTSTARENSALLLESGCSLGEPAVISVDCDDRSNRNTRTRTGRRISITITPPPLGAPVTDINTAQLSNERQGYGTLPNGKDIITQQPLPSIPTRGGLLGGKKPKQKCYNGMGDWTLVTSKDPAESSPLLEDSVHIVVEKPNRFCKWRCPAFC